MLRLHFVLKDNEVTDHESGIFHEVKVWCTKCHRITKDDVSQLKYIELFSDHIIERTNYPDKEKRP